MCYHLICISWLKILIYRLKKVLLAKHKSLQFYTDPFGQYMATLHTVGKEKGIDYNQSLNSLSKEAIDIALFGTAENWNMMSIGNIIAKAGQESIILQGPWKGIVNLLLEEYYRKHANGKGDDLERISN